jgi:hypothetical protein
VTVALELLGIECRYDLFSLRYVVSGHPLAEFVGELSDPMLFRLAELVFERFRLSPAIGVVMEAVQTLANHHRFHPVRDYLDGLEWDGTPRIDSWLVSLRRGRRYALHSRGRGVDADRGGAAGARARLQIR